MAIVYRLHSTACSTLPMATSLRLAIWSVAITWLLWGGTLTASAATQTADQATSNPVTSASDDTPEAIDEARQGQDESLAPDWSKLASAELLTSAYEAANTATSEADLKSILAKCQELRGRELAEDQSQHATRLTAWAKFRLAELLIDRASHEFLSAQQSQKTGTANTEEKQAEYAAKIEAANRLTREAINHYSASYDDDPTLLQAKFGLGIAHTMIGEYESAEALFAFVVEANPDHAESHFNRAEFLYHLGKIDAAIDSYSAALELRPQDPACYTGRGHAYLKSGAADKALLDFKRSVQMQPNNARALINRGDAYLQLGKWEDALNDYIVARGEEPSFAIPCQRMAWVMATSPDLKLRNESGAYELAIEAIKLNGQANARLMDTLAATQAANGWFADAEATLKQARELDPDGFNEGTARRLEMYQAERPYVDQATIR